MQCLPSVLTGGGWRHRHGGEFDQRQPAIIEQDPIVVETNGDHSMVLCHRQIAQDNEFHIHRGDTCSLQRNVFCNGAILAVAAAGRKRLKRRALSVRYTPLRQIAWANCIINCAIDGPDAGTAGLRATFGDDGEEFRAASGQWSMLA
jgi:hypothetical protein